MTKMLNQADLVALFLAVERHQHDTAPFPIVGPITVRNAGQTRFYDVPVVITDADGTSAPETLIITVRPIHTSSEYPGALVGEPITTGSPISYQPVIVRQGVPVATVATAEPTNTDEPALDQQAA